MMCPHRYDRRRCSERMPSPSPKDHLPTFQWVDINIWLGYLFFVPLKTFHSVLPPIYRVFRCNFRPKPMSYASNWLEWSRFFLLNWRDATIIIRGRCITCCSEALHQFCSCSHLCWAEDDIFLLPSILQPSIKSDQHPLHHFYRFISLSSINASLFSICGALKGWKPAWRPVRVRGVKYYGGTW